MRGWRRAGIVPSSPAPAASWTVRQEESRRGGASERPASGSNMLHNMLHSSSISVDRLSHPLWLCPLPRRTTSGGAGNDDDAATAAAGEIWQRLLRATHGGQRQRGCTQTHQTTAAHAGVDGHADSLRTPMGGQRNSQGKSGTQNSSVNLPGPAAQAPDGNVASV